MEIPGVEGSGSQGDVAVRSDQAQARFPHSVVRVRRPVQIPDQRPDAYPLRRCVRSGDHGVAADEVSVAFAGNAGHNLGETPENLRRWQLPRKGEQRVAGVTQEVVQTARLGPRERSVRRAVPGVRDTRTIRECPNRPNQSVSALPRYDRAAAVVHSQFRGRVHGALLHRAGAQHHGDDAVA